MLKKKVGESSLKIICENLEEILERFRKMFRTYEQKWGDTYFPEF